MRRWLKFVLLIYVVSLSVWIGYRFYAYSQNATLSASFKSYASERPFQAGGIELTKYSGEQADWKLKAEQFAVRPRKYGVFRIKSVNEVYFKDFYLETPSDKPVFHDEQETDSEYSIFEDHVSLGQMLANNLDNVFRLHKLGKIQRVVIDGFKHLTFSAGKKQLERVVAAKKATFVFKKNELEMKNARVELITLKRRLSAKELMWDDRKKVWRVGEKATLTENGKRSTLKHAELNERLEPINSH